MKNSYNKLILNNPELTRNFWIELNSTRLLIMPLVFVLFLLLISTFSSNFADAVVIFTSIMFNIIVFIWGSKLSADSVINEINERTWDNQVLSLITPWQMTIGKLFGATSYAWYGGLILIILNFIAAFFVDNTSLVLKISLTNLFNAITIHAVIISLTLIGIKKNRFRTKINSTLYFLIGIFIAWYLGYSTFIFYFFETTTFAGIFNLSKTILWHNISFEINDFMLLSSIPFLFWSVAGLYRSFKYELGYRSGFSVWLGFLIYIIFYISGFSSQISEIIATKEVYYIGSYLSYFSLLLITYFALFLESKHLTDYKKLFKSFKIKDFKELSNNLPLWVISLILSIILALITLIITLTYLINKNDSFFFDISVFLPINLLLFLIRDICFVHYINFSAKFKKPDFTSLVFLFLSYSLLPGILSVFDLNGLVPLFFPFAESSFFNGTIPVMLQAILVFFIMKKKYKLISNKTDTSAR